MVDAKSVCQQDIVNRFKSDIFSTNNDSTLRRLSRFFNNEHFNPRQFYKEFITQVIKDMKIKRDKFIITMDHMYTKNFYYSLVFTLRVGNQGIPIWFCSKKSPFSDRDHHEMIIDSENTDDSNDENKVFTTLYNLDFVKNAIDEVLSLFDDYDRENIIFLGDRWFFNIDLLKHIHDSGAKYVVRAKVNSETFVYVYDKKEKHCIFKHLYDFHFTLYHSLYFKDIKLGKTDMFKCNLSISRGIVSNDPWFLISNINPNEAVREYRKRFGAIECMFKNQKSNGFNLEKTQIKSSHAFEKLYMICCISITWITIIGADYVKNKIHLEKYIKINFLKKDKDKKIRRLISPFKLGLIVFQKIYSNIIPMKLKCNMVLYN